jgi:hypothetical protein
MLKIGMDRTDRTFRHFEYDDERMYGNPQVFKVLYEETGEFGEVKCSNVISIKKSTNTHNHFLNIPIYSDVKNDDMSKSNKTTLSDDVNEMTKLLENQVDKKKSKSSTKTKSKTTPLKGEPIEIKETSLNLENSSPKSYMYDILVVDNISYTDDVKSKLNEFGKDGWEVCGFQMNQRIFGGGCQAVIIMKKGLN